VPDAKQMDADQAPETQKSSESVKPTAKTSKSTDAPKFTLAQHVKHAQELHGYPDWLVRQALKGTKYGPTDFFTADELADDLKKILDHEVVPAGQERI
jgi:hypothetical protein